MNHTINNIIILYDIPIRESQIPQFRGAILSVVNDCPNIVFHNHIDDKFHYSYPLVQYKCIDNKAAIQLIGDGAKQVGFLISNDVKTISIGRNEFDFTIQSISTDQSTIHKVEMPVIYQLSNWLPLNEANYPIFHTLRNNEEKQNFLGKILIGNIISMCKGLNIHIEHQIEIEICNMNQFEINYKQIKLSAFNIKFLCNTTLPQYIGLGKAASKGYGMLTIIKQ